MRCGTPTGALEIRGATTHNLRGVDVDIPLGVLVAVTGVAGSGKSSLVHGSIPAGAGVVSVDQNGIRGSRRSSPATYTGLLDPIRKAFAKANGVKPALFSANSEGACPTCNGAGVVYTDLGFMETVASVCEECEGKGFQAAVLEYRLGGRDISEVLAMSVTEAEEFFGAGEARTPAAHAVLGRLADVGLGYLTIGQPLPTLSGGERQRLKLATHMAEKGGVYVLDEPTTGLHLADVEQLLGLLDRLVDSGKSVIVVSHHQAVMAHADWIVDLGPGAGHDGGRSSSRARPPTSSPPAPPSPASTSRPTSASDRGRRAGQPPRGRAARRAWSVLAPARPGSGITGAGGAEQVPERPARVLQRRLEVEVGGGDDHLHEDPVEQDRGELAERRRSAGLRPCLRARGREHLAGPGVPALVVGHEVRAQLGVAGGLGQELVEGGEALDALLDLLRAAHDEVDALVEGRAGGRPGAEVVRLRDGDLLEEREHQLLLAAEVVPDTGLVDARLGRDRLQRQALVAAAR